MGWGQCDLKVGLAPISGLWVSSLELGRSSISQGALGRGGAEFQGKAPNRARRPDEGSACERMHTTVAELRWDLFLANCIAAQGVGGRDGPSPLFFRVPCSPHQRVVDESAFGDSDGNREEE